MINLSQSDSQIEVNGKMGFNPIERVTNLVHRWLQDKGKGIGVAVYCNGARKNLSFSSTQQYYRQKYMPLRHALLRI